MMWILLGIAAWIAGWALNIRLAGRPRSRAVSLAVPVIFGATLIVMWEAAVRGFGISPVLLPAPSAIAEEFGHSAHLLREDFVQTVIKGALTGYLIGCAAALVVEGAGRGVGGFHVRFLSVMGVSEGGWWLSAG